MKKMKDFFSERFVRELHEEFLRVNQQIHGFQPFGHPFELSQEELIKLKMLSNKLLFLMYVSKSCTLDDYVSLTYFVGEIEVPRHVK